MLILSLFIVAKKPLININVLMLRVGEISSLRFLSQNVAQLSVKHNLD